jgi:hypothetical protein
LLIREQCQVRAVGLVHAGHPEITDDGVAHNAGMQTILKKISRGTRCHQADRDTTNDDLACPFMQLFEIRPSRMPQELRRGVGLTRDTSRNRLFCSRFCCLAIVAGLTCR